MDSLPLSPSDVAVLLAPFGALPQRVAAAVSGGPDSMALAYCLKRHGLDVIGLIVEHGLRPESAMEAETVAARLRGMQIEAVVLPWIHGPVTSQIHVQARRARYALLFEACRAHGISTLFLAHHADDQAETVLMRLSKGSGIDGLAAMAPETAQEGVRLLRPLLDVRKSRLVATCATAAIETVCDPSNEKQSYARGRLRRVAEGLAQEGLTVETLGDLAARAGEAKEALNYYARQILETDARFVAGGAIELDWATAKNAPKAIQLRVLAACLGAVAGAQDYPPERAGLLGLLEKMDNGTPFGCTFYGCAISRSNEGPALFIRELAAIPDPRSIAPGETLVWDGRWRVTLTPEAETGLLLAPLGAFPHDQTDFLAPTLRKLVPRGRVRQTLPAVWKGARCVGIPAFHKEDQRIANASPLLPFWVKDEPCSL